MEDNRNVWIELNVEEGVVAVHGDVADAPFVARISPAIVRLHEWTLAMQRTFANPDQEVTEPPTTSA